MFNRLFLVPAILSVAGLLMGANSAFAQRGGGGHGGGGHGGGHSGGAHYGGGGAHYGGGHSSYGFGGGYYGGGYYGGGLYGGGLYGGGLYGGGLYGGGYYGGGSYPLYNSYSYPNSSYYNAPTIRYYQPTTEYPPQPAPVAANYANIQVILPDPQGRVWFDGNATQQTGTDRLFNTPSLANGSTFRYQIRASWMQDGKEVSQERTVSVTPGQTTVVNFTR